MLTCLECGATYPDGTARCPKDGFALLADAPLAPGTMVGEYRVDRRLGAGTFGEVYAGEQPLIGKRVAIKLLHPKFSADPEVVSRFVAEARAVNRIRHRNIIDIFSFGLLGERRHYFVMELLDGLTLGELLARERRISVQKAIPILRGIAAALDAAHEAGVTHRDLKPDNIFLATEKDGSYFPKLLDFGIAKLVTEDMAHKTATGVAMGTPRYMSPEQVRGKKVDHRADIYALGVVIHEMLTGQPLFDGESAIDVVFKHTTDPPPAMSSVCADLPPELDAPVLAMVAKRPSARPSSAGKAVEALIDQAAMSGQAATVRLDPGSSSGRSPERSPARAPETVETAVETAVAPVSPASGTLLTDDAPPTRALPVAGPTATLPSATQDPLSIPALDPRPTPPAAPRAGRSWALAAVAVAVAMGTIALLQSHPTPAPDVAASAPSAAPTSATATSATVLEASREVTAGATAAPTDAGVAPVSPPPASVPLPDAGPARLPGRARYHPDVEPPPYRPPK